LGDRNYGEKLPYKSAINDVIGSIWAGFFAEMPESGKKTQLFSW
jgi:hypothetical protein